jgi:hypothetical protein
MCPPEKYAESTFSFRRKCFTTKWLEVDAEGKKRRTFSEYKPDKVSKAVHIIRDPFDNIVSRFHLEQKLPNKTAKDYPKTREGFRDYCSSIDRIHEMSEKRTMFLDDDLMEIMRKVPCYADFIRYIEWHNLAFVTTQDLELDTYVLHYDWYTTRFNTTTRELLDFLNLEMKAEPTPFLTGKEYPYFTEDEKLALKEGFRRMASELTWKHVEQYFPDSAIDEKAVKIPTVINRIPDATSVKQAPAAVSTDDGRPPLSELVGDSPIDVRADVQFLMDWAIVGYPKTATSTKLRWLSRQKEIKAYDYEIYHLKNGEPADMVRKLYELPAGDQYKRGYKAPRDIHNIRALYAFAAFWPKTKLIVGLRHPVLWFESFYNYRIRSNVPLPPADALAGRCPPGAHNVCADEIRYNDHLSRLGKTPRSNAEELALLSPITKEDRELPKLENPIFLYEISQMHDSDEKRAAQYRVDLQNYLGLNEPIAPLTEDKEVHGDHPNKDKEINICEESHRELHDELMKIARDSSLWIRHYFVTLPDVHVSSPEYFNELLESWMIDPCVARRRNQQDAETEQASLTSTS